MSRSLSMPPAPRLRIGRRHRRAILVSLSWTRDKDPRVPLGHASLLSMLAREDVEARSVVHSVNGALDLESLAGVVLDHAAGRPPEDVDVAIGAYVWGEETLRELLPILRARGLRGRIIMGGPQISYAGEELEGLYPDADVFVRGYGEEALAALVRAPQKRAIPGAHFAGTKDAGRIARIDLEALPSPWLDGTVPVDGQRFVRWETQRGCPFRCTFCQHREPGARLRCRAFAQDRLVEEIDLFCAAGVDDVAVLDPIFNLAPRAIEILDAFADRGFAGRLSLQCRAEALDAPFLDAALDVRRARVSRRGASAADRETLSAQADTRLRVEHRRRAHLGVVGRFVAMDSGAARPDTLAARIVAELASISR